MTDDALRVDQRLADVKVPHPLLIVAGEPRTLRGTSVQLTPDGEKVLAGEGNAVEWNGINDWIAGVHVDSDSGRVWFHKDRTLIAG